MAHDQYKYADSIVTAEPEKRKNYDSESFEEIIGISLNAVPDVSEMPALDTGALVTSAFAKTSDLSGKWAAAIAQEEKDQRQEEPHLAPMQEFRASKNLRNAADSRHDLDFILDIPLEVSAELGRRRLLVNELLQLEEGAVLELNKLAGEPLELFVNGKLVARGEAVVVNDKFGVRLTDIISPMERVKQLG